MTGTTSNIDKKDEGKSRSFETFQFLGMALDPIHVGTGGTRLGRVDNTIVRDPVTRIPKIPGSSLAGVMRAYTAMHFENNRNIQREKPYYPDCAGQGGGDSGHCGKGNCKVCTVFGFAKGKDSEGGFAGLAGFSDMHVLLFPVASRLGPQWITCPMALQQLTGNSSQDLDSFTNENAFYTKENVKILNLGWLNLPVETDARLKDKISGLDRFELPQHIKDHLGILSDKLFAHIVNSNLEVRTSVAINPATGAAEDRALFTYEALPRSTVLAWELTCRNPEHFQINGEKITAVKSTRDVKNVVANAHSYLRHLGIGGMGTRGMGRLRVWDQKEAPRDDKSEEEGSK